MILRTARQTGRVSGQYSCAARERQTRCHLVAAIRHQLHRLLVPQLKGEQLDELRDIIDEDAPAPGAIRIDVNAAYPAGEPYPTAPTSVLLALPPLPTPIEYRIIGKDLILVDRPADLIADYIRNLLP